MVAEAFFYTTILISLLCGGVNIVVFSASRFHLHVFWNAIFYVHFLFFLQLQQSALCGIGIANHGCAVMSCHVHVQLSHMMARCFFLLVNLFLIPSLHRFSLPPSLLPLPSTVLCRIIPIGSVMHPLGMSTTL